MFTSSSTEPRPQFDCNCFAPPLHHIYFTSPRHRLNLTSSSPPPHLQCALVAHLLLLHLTSKSPRLQSRRYLASTSPLRRLYLPSTSPLPHLDLASTSPRPHLYLTSTSPRPHLDLAATSPPPHFDLTSTSPLPRLYITSASRVTRLPPRPLP